MHKNKLKIVKICPYCKGDSKLNSTDMCSYCFGSGTEILKISNIISYEEIDNEE